MTKALVEEKHREWIDMDVPIYDEKRGDLLTIDGTTDGKTVEPNDYAVEFPLRQHSTRTWQIGWHGSATCSLALQSTKEH